MKQVTINTGQVALIMRNGIFKKVLTEGKHWLHFNSIVQLYDLTKPFLPAIDLSILLKNKAIQNIVEVIEVKDNEIALLYQNETFKYVLQAGKHAFFKGVYEYKFQKADISKVEINEDIPAYILQRPEMNAFVRVLTVEPYERALLFINEKMERILEPGDYYFWKNAIKVKIAKADNRLQLLEVSGQEILTSDKAELRINFQAQYKITDIEKARNENSECEKQLYTLMQLALREFIGTQTLDEILENKESISKYLSNMIKDKSQKLGIMVADCGVKDIILPGDIKEIMNQVLIAQKRAQANTVTRREETASTRSLLNTAKLMEENDMLFKLKEMEYVEKIADKINSISLSGGNQVLNQLKEIFSTSK